ncbi:peroxiredoxin-like family protein [Flavobacteriaceae bacterium 3-367]|uniref:peroxiredoxin family protein n=1 Tax=Eudoraea algarum TaxID=3417568 RepID=UPI003280A0DF
MENLKNGDQAVPFSCPDLHGNPINLSDYRGKKVLLSFFRGAPCPFCNLRVHQLIGRYAEFEAAGIAIIIFFAASKEEIMSYAGKQDAPFPIIPDPALEIYKKYGIEQSSRGMIRAMLQPGKMWKVMTSGFFNMKSIREQPIIPADFLIDENQVLQKVYYGKDFGDHLSIAEILP